MVSRNSNQIFIFWTLLLLATCASLVHGHKGTRVGFYSTTCPRAESIVSSTVQCHFNSDHTVAAGLLRMHFHDCFMRGCDASVLIDGPNTQKKAVANLGLRGYEVIDDAKTQLEAACPGVVSCADILALAARDAVVLVNGSSWVVPTGRRDGRVSLVSDADSLPAFTDCIDVQKQKFSALGLNTHDLVVLAGGHTIGTSACQFFQYRMYNFTKVKNGAVDSSINPAFLPQLQALCPQYGDGSKRVALDTHSPNRFDTSYFRNMRIGQGILESDQMLWNDASTKAIVQHLLLGLNFEEEFGNSMIKMSNIGVKTGNAGEIRQADLGEIWPDLDEISAYLKEIRPNLDKFSPDSSSSGQISTDRTENGRFSFEFRSESTNRIENEGFSGQLQSGQLNIGFSASNSPTDPPFSGSGNRDPSPTRHRRRVGQFSIQADLGEIWPDLDEISAYLEEIRPNLDKFSPDSSSLGQISTDQTENGRFSFEFRSESIDRTENEGFSGQLQSGQLNIGFSASNSPTDPLFSSLGNRDPSSTRHWRRVGRFSVKVGRFGRVDWIPDLAGHP
ncbi:hypothetical protein SO802_029365 [Lithocarpus litseifolius]|uniref:peroxidase n=1 Tax=Lithocarpus litseifolius TaxID=425828 RepID=A0AAW2BUY3_9ROSI